MSGYICGYIFMADFYVANYKQHTGAYESLTLKNQETSSDRGLLFCGLFNLSKFFRELRSFCYLFLQNAEVLTKAWTRPL
jgi:hypothetical protein